MIINGLQKSRVSIDKLLILRTHNGLVPLWICVVAILNSMFQIKLVSNKITHYNLELTHHFILSSQQNASINLR